MTLSAGKRLGPYEIVAPIGAGGMGEVYKARDTRLGRDVAIKVLPSHLSDNPELKQRFEREARAVSQLSHANICALYDVGDEAGVEYLVMELLEGQTLEDRLLRGALSVEQVLRIGIEIAGALEAAHRKGIVHRDLKPGNVMLTKSGVKLLDFGLAKALAPAAPAGGGTSLPTEAVPSRPLTEQGTILGTFQYMAPEQLEGAEADARSDIFALGAVLYEMASGRRAFSGKTRVSLIGSILKDDPPPISTVAPMTPPALDRVVRTCLAKDPDDRWQSAHDVRSELAWIAEAGSQAGAPAVVVSRRKGRERLAWICAGAAFAGALAFAAAYLRLANAPRPVLRASIVPPEKSRFAFAGDNAGPPAISPDGENVAFVASGDGRPMLYVRPLAALTATPLPGTEDAIFPFWSPDSRSLGFFADGKLKRIDISAGGAAATICGAPNARGGAWNEDGVILFEPDTREGIFRVAASGGAPVPVTKIDPALHTTHRWPVFLPGGKHFLYFAGNHNDTRSEQSGIYFASLDGKENRRLVHTLAGALYSSGDLLYLRENTLLARPFDPSTGRLLGDPVPAADGVQFDPSTWHGVFSVSRGNVLAYQAGGIGSGSRLAWYDRSGKALGTLGERDDYYGPVRISPDGKKVAVAIGDPGDIFVFDVGSGLKTRLTFSPSTYAVGSWSPDGRQLLFSSLRMKGGRFAMFVKASNGASPEQLLQTPPSDVGQIAGDWSRNGNFAVYVENTQRQLPREWLFPFGGQRKPRELLTQHDGNESEAAFSPDSRWVAYQIFTSGAPTLFVSAVDGSGGKWQVSSAGGYAPRWRDDGREIYYIGPDLTLMAVEVDGTGAEFRVGPVKPLFHAPAASNPAYTFDTHDGQRFLFNSLDEEGAPPISLVLNWKATLKR